jgi:osmoprotectant transport system permease protein
MSYLFDPYNWDLSDPASIPNLLLRHIGITAISVLLGLVIAFPIALVVVRRRALYAPVITVADVVYTLPSLAVVALLIPLTGLGATTIIIPLIAYTQVVLIRNIVAAIDAVDPTLVEVGRAMGMDRRQIQVKVILPLALPVIIAGVRVATVTTIGIATVGGLIGAHDLGDLIFGGISLLPQTGEIVAGAVTITLLAIVADVALLGAQRYLGRGRGSLAL